MLDLERQSEESLSQATADKGARDEGSCGGKIRCLLVKKTEKHMGIQ